MASKPKIAILAGFPAWLYTDRLPAYKGHYAIWLAALQEARVAGLPVILSNECGSCQHVEEGKSGFIFNPHDVDGLVRSVLAVTKDAKTAQAMGGFGHAECRQALSVENMVGNLLSIYREILLGAA